MPTLRVENLTSLLKCCNVKYGEDDLITCKEKHAPFWNACASHFPPRKPDHVEVHPEPGRRLLLLVEDTQRHGDTIKELPQIQNRER